MNTLQNAGPIIYYILMVLSETRLQLPDFSPVLIFGTTWKILHFRSRPAGIPIIPECDPGRNFSRNKDIA